MKPSRFAGFRPLSDDLAKMLWEEPTVRKGLGPEGGPVVLEGYFAPTWVVRLAEALPIGFAGIRLQQVLNVARADPERLASAVLALLRMGPPGLERLESVKIWVLEHEEEHVEGKHSEALTEHLMEHEQKPTTLGELRTALKATSTRAKGLVRNGNLIVRATPVKERHDGP